MLYIGWGINSKSHKTKPLFIGFYSIVAYCKLNFIVRQILRSLTHLIACHSVFNDIVFSFWDHTWKELGLFTFVSCSERVPLLGGSVFALISLNLFSIQSVTFNTIFFQFYPGSKRPVWFVFTGLGSEWAGMRKPLLKFPIFAAAIGKCHRVLELHGVDLINVITSDNPKLFDNILNCFVGIAACQLIVTVQLAFKYQLLHRMGDFVSLNYPKLNSAIWCTGVGDVRNGRTFCVHKLSLKY